MTNAMEDLGMSVEEAVRSRGSSVNRRRSERVIYYRKANGWITWGDSQSSKQIDYIARGWQPLTQFGQITGTTYNRQTGEHDPDPASVWGPILRHRDGPGQFPLQQILTYRWYKKPPVRGVRFPQLEGVEVTEYQCPECDDREYHDVSHLARHLRNQHDYDRLEINQLGKDLGIDFNRQVEHGGRKVYSYEADETLDPGYQPDGSEEEPQATVQSVRPRSRKSGE